MNSRRLLTASALAALLPTLLSAHLATRAQQQQPPPRPQPTRPPASEGPAGIQNVPRPTPPKEVGPGPRVRIEQVALKTWLAESAPGKGDAWSINPLQFRWKREIRLMVSGMSPDGDPTGVFDLKIVKWEGCKAPIADPIPGQKPPGDPCGQINLQEVMNSAVACAADAPTCVVLDLTNKTYTLGGNPPVFSYNLDNAAAPVLELYQKYLFQVRERFDGKVVASSPVTMFEYQQQ